MEIELNALEANDTWELTSLPARKKPIGTKWVYIVKCKPDGTIDRFKARLVAKGYIQVVGLDYYESYSLVAKVITVRVFIALVTSKGWPIHQMDINNAFLHDYLKEEVYLALLEGYNKGTPDQVCRFKRSLYGLNKPQES